MVESADRSDIIHVLVADAYPIMCTGLVTTIQSDAYMQVIGKATCSQDLKTKLRTLAVDVLVINLVDMGNAPVAIVQEVKQEHRHLGIVVVAASVDFAPELLAVGVRAYVSYTEPDEHLYLSIRAAKARQTYLSPRTQDYMDRWIGLSAKPRFVPRELQIIKYMAQGMDTNEIAKHLDINFWTVRNYVSRIRKKTGWTTWPQMVSWYHTMYGNEVGLKGFRTLT